MQRMMQLALLPLSLIMMLLSAMCQYQRGGCPPGWYVDGCQANGVYACHIDPPPEIPARGPRGGWVDLSQPLDLEYRSRIYCTGGAVPISLPDGRTVGCQRGYTR
jgi:hypothetical protein